MLHQIAQHRHGARTQGRHLFPPPHAAVCHIQTEGPEREVMLVVHRTSCNGCVNGMWTECGHDLDAWGPRGTVFEHSGPVHGQAPDCIFCHEKDNVKMPRTHIAI